MKNINSCMTIAASILAASVAQADLIEYDILWEVVSGSGTATGSVTIDSSLAPNNGDGVFADPFGGAFTNFSVTISGATGGNGTFTSIAGDIDFMLFDTSGFVDFSSELMSQGTVADFNFLSFNPSSPSGNSTNLFYTAGNTDSFSVVSVTPVPAPGAFALLGLTTLAATRRRR